MCSLWIVPVRKFCHQNPNDLRTRKKVAVETHFITILVFPPNRLLQLSGKQELREIKLLISTQRAEI